MTKEEIEKIARHMKGYYPAEGLFPTVGTVALWHNLLQDLPYTAAEAVLNEWVMTHDKPPTIADLRERAYAILHADAPLLDWRQQYTVVIRNIHKYGMYQMEEAMDALLATDKITYETVKQHDGQ